MVIAASTSKATALQNTLAYSGSQKSLQDLEWDFYSNSSNLSPKEKYSLADHKLAFYKLNSSNGSLIEAEISYFKSQGAMGKTYQDLFNDFFTNYSFGIATMQGLRAWFESTNIDGQGNQSLIDGQAVSRWNDLSGNNKHAVQGTAANQPLFNNSSAKTPSGKPSIVFDGSNDDLVFPSIGEKTDATVFVGCVVDGGLGNRNTPLSLEGGLVFVLNDNTLGTGFSIDNGTTTFAKATSLTLGQFNIWGARLRGPSSVWARDGVSLTTVTATTPSLIDTPTHLGRKVNNLLATSLPFRGKMFCCLVFDRFLDSTEFNRVSQYLRKKYGTL